MPEIINAAVPQNQTKMTHVQDKIAPQEQLFCWKDERETSVIILIQLSEETNRHLSEQMDSNFTNWKHLSM